MLQSIGAIRPTTNPYLAQLVGALNNRPDVRVYLFDFKRAFFGRYEVFHVHWPEVLFGGANPVGRLARRMRTALLMVRLTLTRTPIVRTWHNTERPEGLSAWDHRLLDAFDKRTRVVVRLNDVTDPPLDVPVHTVPLGHYRDWYEDHPRADPISGRASYVGLIRRYKGVESLVSAFHGLRDPAMSLTVAGRPSTPELARAIQELAEGDERIEFRFEFVEEADFVRLVTSSELIALPFVQMHNSSTVLTALSLARPVLVPANVVNRRLADEVGSGWIHMYEGELTSEDVERALNAGMPEDEPNLDSRDWETSARLHVTAFRDAIRQRQVELNQSAAT